MKKWLCVAFVAGCGSSTPEGGQDMSLASTTCAMQSMSVGKYTGQAKGALDKATPVILSMQADAQFFQITGGLIDTLSGESESGMNGGQWDIEFYSPTAKRNYKGVFSGEVGHVSCQDIKVKTEPTLQTPPTTGSGDVFATAVERIVADIKKRDPKLKIPARAQSVTFGKVTLGINEPRAQTWHVALPPWAVLVDDGMNQAVDCTYGGAPCK